MSLMFSMDNTLSTDWRAVACEAEVAHTFFRVLRTMGELISGILRMVCFTSSIER